LGKLKALMSTIELRMGAFDLNGNNPLLEEMTK